MPSLQILDIRVLRIMWGGTIPRVTLRYTLGYEPLAHARAFDLSARAVVCGITTEFHGIRHGFSHYCVYQCHVLCYLCLLCDVVCISG